MPTPADVVQSYILATALPYTWCSVDRALAHLPVVEGLGAIKTYLKEAGPIFSER